MKEKRFTKFSEKAILAVAEFLEIPEEKVKEFSWEDEDVVADELFKEVPFMQNTIALNVSEEIFAIYGKKVFLTFLIEAAENEIRTTLILIFGKAKDFARTDRFLDTVNFPMDTEIIYGNYEGDDKNVDVNMEISIVTGVRSSLHENILSVLNRFSEQDGNRDLKEFVEMFEDYRNK